MSLQKRKGTVDGYEWRCRNQSKDNRHDVVRSVRKGTWFNESKLAITIILRLTRYWFGKSMNEFVMNDLKVNKNMTKLIRHVAAILRSQVVDTGSQVTLMKESVWNQLGSPSLINSGNILTGFGLSKTHVIGSFNSTVSIDNQDFPVKINVVPNHSMNFDIIIGCNLIKQANLTITPDSVMFSKLQNEVSDASPQPFVFAITDDIPKFDIGPEIPKQTRNDVEALLVCYRPNKIKTTDIELSITVTDDKPIYHSPRRLPFTERDIVDKQIDEWIQNGVIEPCSSAYASQVLVVRKKTAVHEKIEFLGHIIENNKLFPSPSKTKSVVNYPEPKTTKEVQRFLGLTGYFRKFIPAYSVIAKPLSDLLRKDTPFNFDVKQKASFDELKRLLCQKPVLGIYRQNCETEIHTDASIDGLAAVLLQRFPMIIPYILYITCLEKRPKRRENIPATNSKF
ncbi:retrovirus-related Pol polyprotein from transposon 297 [Trichonephila clavipes]|nr:retrovirus-related Pol polyprotein from transposon 297 [Trichonephila clavipes]